MNSVLKNKADLINSDALDEIKHSLAEWENSLPMRIELLIEQLDSVRVGFPISQKQHALQTATRAYHAGASTEMVVGALCHDIGKLISNHNHAAVAAEMLKPFVGEHVYQVLRTHQEFQAKHFSVEYGTKLDLREKYKHEPWFVLACQFGDEWDSQSFDNSYKSFPLKFFRPLLVEVFTKKIC